jgi:hypothetical protein
MKLGFWKLQVTAGIGNTRNWPIWQPTNLISQLSLDIFLPHRFPFSAMMLAIHNEDKYDRQDFSWVSI